MFHKIKSHGSLILVGKCVCPVVNAKSVEKTMQECINAQFAGSVLIHCQQSILMFIAIQSSLLQRIRP